MFQIHSREDEVGVPAVPGAVFGAVRVFQRRHAAMPTKGHVVIESSFRHSVAHGLVLGKHNCRRAKPCRFPDRVIHINAVGVISARWNSGQEDVHPYSAVNVAARRPNDRLPSRLPPRLPPTFLLSNGPLNDGFLCTSAYCSLLMESLLL